MNTLSRRATQVRRQEGERRRELARQRMAADLADGDAEELAALLRMSYVDLVLWKNTRG